MKLDSGTVIACVNQPQPLSLTEQLQVTVADCKNQPFDLQELPNWDGIIEPAACCGDAAAEMDVEAACVADCSWAACKLAIGALRKAADSVDYGVLAGDLDEFADFLEMPGNLAECFDFVYATTSLGEQGFAEVDLMESSSSNAAIGHVNNLTLHIQCALDEAQPTALDEAAGVCMEPTNIPPLSDESNNGGAFMHASLTAFGPMGDETIDVPRVDFEFEEQLCGQSTCGFTLTRLDGTLAFVERGDYTFENVSYSLSGPAHGVISGENVTFPAGAIRLDVTADATLAGEQIWRAASGTFEVHNTSAAAVQRATSAFSVVDLEFAIGDEILVVTTESAPFVPLTQ